MEKYLSDLIEISRYYGQNKAYVIAGGGNTSYKNDTDLWVKASGTSLSDITENGFALLHRKGLQEIHKKKYSAEPGKREAEVKEDLYHACYSGITLRPSVETSLHEIINYPYVVHTHPTLINAVTCSNKAEETLAHLFGDAALYVPYTDPGYTLFTRINDLLQQWRKMHPADPQVIFLQNHGVLVSANTTNEIKRLYDEIDLSIRKNIRQMPVTKPSEVPDGIVAILPALRMLFSPDHVKLARMRNHSLIRHFISDAKSISAVSLPFTPDQIVYGKSRLVYIEQSLPENCIEECKVKIKEYERQNGYFPSVAAIKSYGVIAFADDVKSADNILDIIDDRMQISFLSENFGGPHFMTESDIEFIENWEVENYRRQVAKSAMGRGKVENKIVIVTGGARGIGRGIAENLMDEGANVVIADLNEQQGQETALALHKSSQKNEAVFVKTNVMEPESIKNLIISTVKHFGGIDVFISNAGILHAGGLEEISMETFESMTKVNYSAYFLCVKYASEVMKLQSGYRNNYFTDIIQINSKSGLKGSNKNFAYAGGKFGGIGLTQSFALELMPYRIKVNSICPGNFFEGPLWSDPETGLFTQYLRAGKVPGAKTLGDIKAHYEKQVPAGRGCLINDVMKAIYYAIEQEYETGQAIPVTGGQEMLS